MSTLGLLILSITLAISIQPLQLLPSPQEAANVYAHIPAIGSDTHWCVPEAGDDPAGIIGGRCKVYRSCLGNAGLAASVDEKPYQKLPDLSVEKLRACHQALYNAARSNPQIKGSKATQDWLEHEVYPGSEAKPFPVPGSLPEPR